MTQCLSDADLLGLVEGKLSADRKAAADAHLRDCTECASRLERARELSSPTLGMHRAPTQVEVTSAMEVSCGSAGVESHWTDNDLPISASSSGSAAAAGISLDEFLSSLSQSGLLPASDLADVRQKSNQDPAYSTVSGLVEWLVDQHKLTRYQAELLARGGKGGLVLGNYIILEKLGQGGMGTVFKARHRRMNRLVALKVLPQALSSVPEAIHRFQREVEAAARLQHPHVAAAFDADEASGVHFLVMEYVDGPNLASYVKHRGPLPLATAVRLMVHAASGLAAAHQQGIVHRDIKPANMMVNKQGVLKVLDMGLAQMRGQEQNLDLTSDVTQTGRVMGTVDYMAPEQARDAKNVDLRADIYSLGCTLWFLATGKSPAPGTSAAEKLLWHQSQVVPALSSEVPQSTPRLDAALSKMMAKKVEDRFASMQEVAVELEQCLAELPAADSGALLDGLDLVAEHGAATIGSSRYGQATMTGSMGDTILTDFGRRSMSGFFTPKTRQSRVMVYAGIIGGTLALVALIAALVMRQSPADAALLVAVDGGPADVLVNGEPRGTAGAAAGRPLELKVRPGKLTVELKRQGFEPYQQVVDAEAGKPVQVAATLKKIEALPQPNNGQSPHLAYEKLLAWVFSNKGQVTAVTGGGEQLHLTSLSSLPNQPVEILGIKLDGTGVQDVDLEMLAMSPRLRELSLADTGITDRGLEQLSPLRQLGHLNLSRTAVTNAGLAQLGRLSALTELNLERTQITNPGIARLLALAKLERLYLSDTKVTDVGIDQLKALHSLRLLTLHGTSLSDAQYTALKKAIPELDIAWDGSDVERGVALKLLDKGATLAVLDRSGQRHEGVKNVENLPPGRVSVKDVNFTTGSTFTDDDLKQIAVLSDIEAVALQGAKISQNGLSHLQGLTTLRRIDLGTLRLPPTAVEALRNALPACQVIVREPADVEVARAVLGRGGHVTIFTERNQLLRDLKTVDQLPAGQYSLRAINLDDVAGIDDAAVAKATELPFIESLFLTNTGVTDATLARLTGCKSLQELSLSGTKVTPAGLSALVPLPKLARLYLAKTTLGSDGIRQVGDLTRLTHLSLLGVSLADDDLAPLKRLSQLEWLDLSNTGLTDAAVVHLSRLGTLHELNVTGTKLSDAAREELAAALGQDCHIVGNPFELQRLAARWFVEHAATVSLENGKLAGSKELPRGACRVLAVNLADLGNLRRDDIKTHLASCKDLVSLDLSGTKLVDTDLSLLRGMPSLRELRLAGLPLTDGALAALSGNPALEILDLSGTSITGQGLQQISAATGLKQLLLANARASDVHFAALSLFPQLEVLDVSATTDVTDAGVEAIVKLPALRVVRLRGARLTDAGLEKLAELLNLEELDVEGSKITDAGVAKLAPLTKLRVIGLARTSVTDSVVETLAQMKQLRSINLARTTVTADAVRRLQAELKGCSITAPALAPRDPNAGQNFGVPGPQRGAFNNFENEP